MSGHSKWSTIKHQKGAKDAKRAKLFTKLARPIMVAAREGGSDMEMNAALRTAVTAAKAANMPKDNIERAIKRGTGEMEGAELVEIRYEGYAPGGVAIMVDAITDNRNRTASAVKHLFTKYGGSLGGPGAVAWMFEQKGVIRVEGNEDETLQLTAIEAGAEDVRVEEGGLTILTPPQDLESVKAALDIEPDFAGLDWIASQTAEADEDTITKASKLIEALEDSDDVNDVYSNADF